MASLVGVTSANPAEKLLLLKTQADTAFAQQIAAAKAVASFAEQIKNHQTPENMGKLQELLTKTQEATKHAAELRRKLLDSELTYYNPSLAENGLGASLEERQVTKLHLEKSPDLEGPPGYFPK